ncbi:alpha-2B adrenergic receptor-like [Paramacrobiotus metropolitanus]|uniref:alpha-2B adrenergic receptor-like n=1 Tax=Paramacrobiotus metropolitanus TaxID=2943436 RepID=UPI0024461F1D|nr:alpha-2B adrenergic receptor-like [Paramacrobiotus metropolitanus]
MSTINSTLLTNVTPVISAVQPKWTPFLTGQAVVLGLSLFSNILVLIEFLRIPSRITPFTVYLIVLLLSNLLFLSVVPLTELSNQLYGRWWMGRAVCYLHNYFNGVGSGSQICIHVSISINRLWAVHYPISYKNNHNKKVALLTCLSAVIFAHVIGLPGCIMDIMYYGIDLKYGCHINYLAQVLWGKFENALLHILPLVLIIGAYVHLCINRVRRRRKIRESGSGKVSAGTSTEDGGKRKEAVRPFLVLSLTAVSVTVCWTPAVVYFAVIKFAGLWMPEWFFILSVMFYSMQALFDPWLFAVALLATNRKWCS